MNDKSFIEYRMMQKIFFGDKKSNKKSDKERIPIYFAKCLNCQFRIPCQEKPIECFRCHHIMDIFTAKTFDHIPTDKSQESLMKTINEEIYLKSNK